MISVGFLELNSIAKGVEAADAILKTADTSLVFSRPICPGKYHILFTGEVAAVESSLQAGKRLAAESVVDDVVIPRVHEQVVQAMNCAIIPEKMEALGIMEFFSITSAVYAADAAAKAADVTLIEVRLGAGIGGKSFVTLTGEVAAVRESVEAGIAGAKKNGLLVQSVVIPSPAPELYQSLL